MLRADSAYDSHDVSAAARRAKVRFSITARMNPAVRRKIIEILVDAWTPITYPNAVWDEDEQRLVSDAEIAEIGSPPSPAAARASRSPPACSCAA